MDHPNVPNLPVQMDDGPWYVNLDLQHVFEYLDASKSMVQGRPNGCSLNGGFRDVQVDVTLN